MNKYRGRIYDHYVTAWNAASVPESLVDLESRGPTFQFVIKKLFPKNKSAYILDLGCGHGAFLYFAKKAGYTNCVGVDVSGQQVSLAARLGIKNITQGDLMGFLCNAAPASLDVVIAFDVIEHFTKEELIDLVDAVYRVLKPDGRWVIHAPNGNSPFVGSIRYGDFTHEQAFTPSSIEQILVSSGFSRAIFAECSPRVHGVKSFFRYFLWRLGRSLLNLINLAETGVAGRDLIWTRNFYTTAFK